MKNGEQLNNQEQPQPVDFTEIVAHVNGIRTTLNRVRSGDKSGIMRINLLRDGLRNVPETLRRKVAWDLLQDSHIQKLFEGEELQKAYEHLVDSA